MLSVENMRRPLQNWCREQPIRLCVMFGSQATGQAHEHSDVDLAIWPARVLSTPERLRWVRELEDLFDQKVSLVLVSADCTLILPRSLINSLFVAVARRC